MTESGAERAAAGCSCSPTPGATTPARWPAPSCKALTGHGIVVRLLADEAADLGLEPDSYEPAMELADSETDAEPRCELTLVIGGDGTHPARRRGHPRHRLTPVLGVNLGHVGLPGRGRVRRPRVDHRRDRAPPLHRRGPAHPRRDVLPRRRGGRQHVRASTRPASRRPPASGCSRWSSRSTAGRCRAGAATASCARPRPARPPTTSAPAARSSGPSVEALLHRADQRARAVRPADGGRARPR